jgi:hypothetical protein
MRGKEDSLENERAVSGHTIRLTLFLTLPEYYESSLDMVCPLIAQRNHDQFIKKRPRSKEGSAHRSAIGVSLAGEVAFRLLPNETQLSALGVSDGVRAWTTRAIF